MSRSPGHLYGIRVGPLGPHGHKVGMASNGPWKIILYRVSLMPLQRVPTTIKLRGKRQSCSRRARYALKLGRDEFNCL